jgi:hypothetical protein
MNSIIDEINDLRIEVERLKEKLADSSETGKRKSSSLDDDEYFENRLGITSARLIRSGPESAAKSFLNSSRIKSGFLGSIGLGGSGFLAGFASGMWSFGVGLLVEGIAKLFQRQRSPLLKAHQIEAVRYMNREILEPWYSRSLESELYRGHSARPMMRERRSDSDSLDRQLMRGVVGL